LEGFFDHTLIHPLKAIAMLYSNPRIRSILAISLFSCHSSLVIQQATPAQEAQPCDRAANVACDDSLAGPSACDSISGGCDGMIEDACWKSIWTRPTLTGDWCGYRTDLQKSGVTFAGRSTHFGFAVDGGINSPPPTPLLGLGDTSKYTGRGEYDLIFDLEKFGGLPKGSLLVRAEHWYGEYGNVSLNTGAFPPAVFAAAVPPTPNDRGDLFLTNFLYTQPLSKEFVFYVGKIDVLGGLDQDDFAGGDGTTQFVNQALIANPAFLLGLPYSSVTAGIVLPREWGRMSAFILDPQDRTSEFFNLDDLFSQGVIVGGETKVNTSFFQKKGEVHVGALWKHNDLTDLRFNEPPPGVYPEPTVPGFATIADSYTFYVGGDQYLVEFADDSARGWGLFYRGSISDANPTPIRYFLSAGLGGYSPVGRTRGDKFGLGWYYVGASNEFGPLPQALFGPGDGTGVESFYSFQVTPWCAISPDVQYIKPEASAIADDAFVYGVRVHMTL
jgi:porin